MAGIPYRVADAVPGPLPERPQRGRPAMATWADFEKQAPEIAEAGRRLLPEVSFLATVSRGGRPRVHPFCPAVAEGRLVAFILEESPKRRDLDHNGRFAIHALPGPEDEQFFAAGRAARVDDARLRAAALAAMPYDDADERHLLYEFVLERALWTTWKNFQKPGMRPIHRSWRESPRTRTM
jgi:hypothetical protein